MFALSKHTHMNSYTTIKDSANGSTLTYGGNEVYALATPKKETEKAIQIAIAFIGSTTGAGYDVWCPKSVVKISGENVTMPEWFFRKNIVSLIN